MRHFLLLPAMLLSLIGVAQVSITGPGSHTQNFNTLISTGTGTWTDNTTITGWYAKRSGTGTSIAADIGSATGGNLYSYGAASNTERALGSLGSGNAAAGSFAYGVGFHNTSGGSISNFQVGYTLEQWRNSAAAAQSVTFWYKVMSTYATDLTPLVNTGWTEVTALMGTGPISGGTASALVGNDPLNKVVLPATLISGLTLADGEYIMFRWLDIDHTGSDHGLSIDDVAISWSGSCNTANTISVSECSSYTVPSGEETYMASGTYMDTIPNAAGCDSILTINLTILGPTTSSFSVSECTSYTVPSGDEMYTVSGTYMDTIPNHLGCDSIMTINLTIVTSITYYADFDGDGLGDPNDTQDACSPPTDYVTNDDDCDDTDDQIGAAQTWYLDADGDGYGGTTSTVNCTAPTNYVSNDDDCDDANPSVHPGGTEIANNGIDEDCSGGDLIIAPASLGQYEFTGNVCATPVFNVTTQPANATFSNYAAIGVDCAMANDVTNNSNWNTSSVVDLNEYYGFSITPATCYGMNLTELHFTHRTSNTMGTPTVHVRSSLDGFTTDIGSFTITTPTVNINEVLVLPTAFATVYGPVEFRFYVTTAAAATGTYRHDNVSLIGLINSLPVATYYADADGDGYGDAAVAVTNCVPPVGYVTDNTDCNDNNEDEHPGAQWVIDNDGDGFAGTVVMTSCTQPVGYIPVGADADCDDNDDQVNGETAYYADADGDGLGDNGAMVMTCTQPVGYVTNNTDCDDTDDQVGAAAFTFYADTDGDTYGDPNNSVPGCAPMAGYVTNADDCDDTNPAVYPGATEVCDGVDNNCDGDIDEGVPTFTFYADADGDGLGDAGSSTQDCSQPTGYVGNDDDCDDTDPTPNAGETVYYMDDDGDGFGDDFNSISTCNQPTGYVAIGGDCNDGDDNINPDAVDTEGDGIDQNCDGVDGNLSVAEAALFNITVSPNPGTNQVFVKVSEDFGVETVEMISVDGKTMAMTVTAVSGGLNINTEALVPGMYIVRLGNGNVFTTVRWVKQ